MPNRDAPRRLRIRLFGAPEILVDGSPLQVDTRKAVAILIVLATDGRPYARDELAALLWPDSDDIGARGALRRTLSVMRSAMGDGLLAVDRTRVDIVREQADIDLVELERRAASQSVPDLAAAADLARGPFLAGFSLRDSPEFDDWRAARAMRVERTVADILDRLVIGLAATGEVAAAAAAAGRRVDLDPLDEGAHVRRMELLAASGDRAAALRQYRACVAILDRELGVPPLPETTARYEAIRDAPHDTDLARPTIRIGDSTPPAPIVTSKPVAALPLVGRDGALAVIAAARVGASPDGRVVAVVGEPGIGKTRLVETALEQARAAGAATLSTRAYAVERRIAYGPIVDALRTALGDATLGPRVRGLDAATLASLAAIVPGLDAAPAGEAHSGSVVQARLLAAIATALEVVLGGERPGLFVVDDLHWADDATLGALAYLVRRLDGRRLAVVLTWRAEELDDTARPVAALASGIAGDAVIALDRLDREDVRALLETVAIADGPATADELWRASEGLPLYIAAALADGPATPGSMPAGVRAVLEERLAGIDGLPAQVLTAAAAIGRSFELTTLRQASGRTEDEIVEAIETLSGRGLIRPADARSDGDLRYDFAHAAVRDLVDGSTSLARRRLLHRRIADVLRSDATGLGRDDPARYARIARHEREAGRDAEAAEAFREAGEAARRVYANREAIELYEASLGLDHPDATGLHTAIGDLRTRLGDYDGAIDAYETAAARATPASLPTIEAALAHAHLRRGDLTAADRHLDAALAGSDDPAWLAHRLVDRAVLRRRAGDRDAAATAASAAEVEAGRTGDPVIIGGARRIAGLIALDRGDTDAAIEALTAAVVAAADDPDPSAGIAAQTGLAMATAAAGDVDEALRHGSAAVEASQRIGDRHLEAAVENHLADILHDAGREADAMEHLKRAVALFAEIGEAESEREPGIWALAAW